MAQTNNALTPSFALKLFVPLAMLFLTVYMSANYIAHLKDLSVGVPSVYFAWEKHIPFIPWFIVIYWGLDLMVISIFATCQTRQELIGVITPLLIVLAISFVCFMVFPLRFAFERPPISGFPKLLFDGLYKFDRPYNQAPSIHIGFLGVLWVFYLNKIKANYRWLLHLWGVLVTLSVLVTYQHHLIDVIAGVAVVGVSLKIAPVLTRRLKLL